MKYKLFLTKKNEIHFMMDLNGNPPLALLVLTKKKKPFSLESERELKTQHKLNRDLTQRNNTQDMAEGYNIPKRSPLMSHNDLTR